MRRWIGIAGTGLLAAAALAARPDGTPVATTQRAGATRGAAPARAPAGAAPRLSWAQYELVVRNNIFMRGGNGSASWDGDDRPTTRPARSTDAAPSLFPSGPSSPASWVLRGTVLEAGERVAFLENGTNAEKMQVHAGDVVAGRRLVRIEAGGVDIEGGDKPQRIVVGMQLDGNVPTATTMPTTAPGEGGDDNTAGSAPVEKTKTVGSNADILEKLRARRRQELSK